MTKSNPFASFAATSGGGGGGGGWMTTNKSASEVKKSKEIAAEARRARTRRGPAKKKEGGAAKGGGKKGGGARGGGRGGGRRKRGGSFIDDSDEESFQGYSEEEDEEDDDFIVGDDDELEENGVGGMDSDEEGDWDSGMEEDSDSDFGGGGKKKNKAKKKKNGAAMSRTSRAQRRTKQKADWKPSNGDSMDDELEESPMPPSRARGRQQQRRNVRKKAEQSPISVNSDEEMSDVDDIYADTKSNKNHGKKKSTVDMSLDSDSSSATESPSPPKKKKKSKYFTKDDSFEDEKKEEDDEEDENLLNGSKKMGTKGNSKKKRRVLDSDSDDSDDDIAAWGKPKPKTDAIDLFDDDDLSDTPKKPSALSVDDYVDDDEAKAIQAAMKASLSDQSKGTKRLKKKGGKKSRKLGGSSSSSLEQIKQASPAKEKVVYKDDIEPLQDSDDDVHVDDEVEVYEVDAEEQTAAQVLAEANALSAKIVTIVSGWCGVNGSNDDKDEGGEGSEGSNSGGKVKGLILGGDEGALNLGNGVNTTMSAEDGSWISDETMKQILPNVKLAEYQLLGVNWMALLNRTVFGKGGSGKSGKKKKGGNVNGILADEMGLGKTVQTIAFLAWLNHQSKNNPNDEDGTSQLQRPHLIVVPASVLSNWMNEFSKFAPDMIVRKYHGNQAEREEIRSEMETQFIHGNEPLDVVMTTFSYFSSDSNKGDRSFLRRFEFDYLVVDEGHTLKNPKGLRYQNLNKFNSSHRLLLTGTPVQNSPKELMSLLCFLMPLFDSKTKSTKRKRGYGNDSDDEDDGGERMLEYFVHLEGGDDDATAYRKLKQLFAPFVLRRKKEDVLGQILPPKTRQVDIVPMDESTQSAYDGIISNHIKARTEKADSAAQKHLFTTLRKAANHPLLLRNRFTSEEEKNKLAHLAMNYGWFGSDPSCTLQLVRDELDKYSDYEIHCAAIQMIEENPPRREHLGKYTLMEDDLFCSPKFVRLRSLLPELIGKSHRILIFSQWTKVLDLMGHLLHSIQIDNYLRLDGQTAVSERQDLIDKFTNDSSIPVFLLSTRAGGMGLNLTSADVCILHDLDFNPFNDRQAEDRCHRIGQKKPVTIIKMVTEGTVDEDIYKIQERKARMNEAIMEENRKKKTSDNQEMARLANAAVERFKAKSPMRPSSGTTAASGPSTSAAPAATTTTTAPVINID